MTTPAPTISALALGNYLKIVSKGAVYNNLSEDSPMWEMIKKKKKGPEEGRELRFLLRSAYGIAAARGVKVDGGAYPKSQKSTLNEGLANYKDFALSIEVERTVIARAMADFSKYGEPLAEELRAKTISMSRVLSSWLYKDGTGVIAQALDAGTVSAGQTIFNLDPANTARGFVGWVEYGDRLTPRNADGTVANPTVSSGTFDHYIVADRSRAANTATLGARDVDGNTLTVTATGITAGDVLYRGTNAEVSAGRITIPDLTAISTDDYNRQSDEFVGLGSLSQNDGRKVNGITLSGSLGGTRKDLDGAPIDSQHFQELMSQLMIAAGNGRYKYNRAMMAWETLDALIESREVDRRFNSVTDNKRGVSGLGYVHGKNTLMFEADEFCPKQKIYVVPEGDVIQFYGSDFEFVRAEGGPKFHLKPNSSGYDRTNQAFMEGNGSLLSVHSAAIGCIEDFTV